MIVASLGIFIGATFSSGMMEVARKGIFNPEYFSFAEVMVIFAAVMLTDIILLDLFNTFGLPTSTTVSIVFELLGAAVAVSLIKISAAGQGIEALGDYINSSKALAIIAGILLSVVIAFSIGTGIQYVSRLLFSFRYRRRLKIFGAIWAGFSLTALTYFLVIKGMKGASFISEESLAWVQAHTLPLMLASLAFWSGLMQLLVSFFRINILRIVVLFGTFALAMAFAGNDLVNFIGVPIAGFESFRLWSGSGVAPEAFSMEMLRAPVRTDTWLLLVAGLVMVTTLWFSKKARSVTETEVNLGRQDEGSERFNPNAISRGIVRMLSGAGSLTRGWIPARFKRTVNASFRPLPDHLLTSDRPAFDLVRASVNLTVASLLISLATSMKLPLSTTYVSFMVAMGTSLADRAWGRDSAVYRVAGVINVIAGWFFTALIAFTIAALFAWLIHAFGIWAVGGLLLFAGFLISRSFIYHKRREKEKESKQAFEKKKETIPVIRVKSDTLQKAIFTLESVRSAHSIAIQGLFSEDLDVIRAAEKELEGLREKNDNFRSNLVRYIRRMQEDRPEVGKLYISVFDLEQDLLLSLGFIVESCVRHVENVHQPLKTWQQIQLRDFLQAMGLYFDRIKHMLENGNFSHLPSLLEEKKLLFADLELLISDQIRGVRTGRYSSRNGELLFSILLQTKDIIAVAARFVKLYARIERPPGSVEIVPPVEENLGK
jgi:phosphate/sulfate permease